MAAASLIFLIIISAASFHLDTVVEVEAQQQRHSNISLGSTLTPTSTTNSSWLSMSGLYAFGFYPEGNGFAVGVFLAGIPEKTVVWTANRDNPPVSSNATLALSSEGMLILRQPQSQDDTSITNISQPASSASMLDSGNFVLYNSVQDIIWESFGHPTDTILPGQPLSAGQDLYSSASDSDHSTGIFRLAMQGDGHLVQYPASMSGPKYAYWASGTYGSGDNCSLNLDSDGYLYMLNATRANIKSLTTAEPTTEKKIYMMKIDVDGIFRVYSHTLDPEDKWSIWWNSSADKCDPASCSWSSQLCVATAHT